MIKFYGKLSNFFSQDVVNNNCILNITDDISDVSNNDVSNNDVSNTQLVIICDSKEFCDTTHEEQRNSPTKKKNIE